MTRRLREIAKSLPPGLTRDDLRGIQALYQRLPKEQAKAPRNEDASYYLNAWKKCIGPVGDSGDSVIVVGALAAGHTEWLGSPPRVWDFADLRAKARTCVQREGYSNTIRAVAMMYQEGTPLSWVERKGPEFLFSESNWEKHIRPALATQRKSRGQPESTHTQQHTHGVRSAR